MIPAAAKYLTPQHDHEDYGFKAGKRYKIKTNEGRRYIMGDGPTYLDNGEIIKSAIDDFIIEY